MDRTLQQWKDRLGQITWRWQELVEAAKAAEADRNECLRKIAEIESTNKDTP